MRPVTHRDFLSATLDFLSAREMEMKLSSGAMVWSTQVPGYGVAAVPYR